MGLPFAFASKRLCVQKVRYENETKRASESHFQLNTLSQRLVLTKSGFDRLVLEQRQMATSAHKHHSRLKSMSKPVNNQLFLSVFTSYINEIPKWRRYLQQITDSLKENMLRRGDF